MSSEWLNGGANVVGTSHLDSKTPCQDSFAIEYSEDKNWIAAAVCDGAGSAKKSEVGSKLVANAFAKKLIYLSEEFKTKQPGTWINDYIIQQVLNVRNELRKIANSDNLEDYHTTLVACLVGKTGGFVIHIGDGSLVGGVAFEDKNTLVIDYERFISEPQNGEYLNETFFITEPNWIKNIRVTPLPPLDWFLIGTDGGSAFYLNHLNIDKQDFITSFIGEVRKIPPTEWSAKIKKILEDNRAINVTNDDKTLIFFAKKNFINKDLKMMFKNPNTQGIAQENKKKEEEQVFENGKQNKNKAGFQESKFKSHKLLLIIVFASSLLLGLVSYFLIN
jgi:hypothetical protein